MMIISLPLNVSGCKDLTGSPGLPAGTPNPSDYNNTAGALEMRNAALFEMEKALPVYLLESGRLTDELEDFQTGSSLGTLLQNGNSVPDPLDERILPNGTVVASYGSLQGVRTFTNQALGALAAYDTAAASQDSAQVLRGELYAMEGYAEIMLADLFCSGVPLSTLDFQKDFTYAPSSTSDQVYRDAIAKFDTALTLAAKNDSVVHLAQVGLGRAYLDRGLYDSAAAVVATVPDGFQYTLTAHWALDEINGQSIPGEINGSLIPGGTVSDSEGSNGLPFLSSDDPRTTVDTLVEPTPVSSGITGVFIPLTFPTKYKAVTTGYTPVTLASGVEARLIQAEAALNIGDDAGMITTLNTLRTNAVANTHGVVATSLPSTLRDPGTDSARVRLLFRERAFWLFLDGHRQGDLRRLLRQYGPHYPVFLSQTRVYPTGAYLAPGTGRYGTDVVVPIPPDESANPDFHGCINYDP